jgi:hypothetical protein
VGFGRGRRGRQRGFVFSEPPIQILVFTDDSRSLQKTENRKVPASTMPVSLYFHLDFSEITADARFSRVSGVLRATGRGVDVDQGKHIIL